MTCTHSLWIVQDPVPFQMLNSILFTVSSSWLLWSCPVLGSITQPLLPFASSCKDSNKMHIFWLWWLVITFLHFETLSLSFVTKIVCGFLVLLSSFSNHFCVEIQKNSNPNCYCHHLLRTYNILYTHTRFLSHTCPIFPNNSLTSQTLNSELLVINLNRMNRYGENTITNNPIEEEEGETAFKTEVLIPGCAL